MKGLFAFTGKEPPVLVDSKIIYGTSLMVKYGYVKNAMLCRRLQRESDTVRKDLLKKI